MALYRAVFWRKSDFISPSQGKLLAVFEQLLRRDFHEVYGPSNGVELVGQVPLRSAPDRVFQRASAERHAAGSTRKPPLCSGIAVRFPQCQTRGIYSSFTQAWVCGGSRLGITHRRSEGNRSGHRDDERARGFDLNAHSLRSAPNRVLHGAGQLRLLKTASCSFQTWPGCSLVYIRGPNVVWFVDCADLRCTWARDESLCALI